MSVEQGWTPAFPGQRPPFEPGNEYRVGTGNELAVRHGAYSPAKVGPRASELMAEAERDRSVTWLESIDRGALWLWACAKATTERAQAYVDELSAAADNGVGDLEDKRVLAAYALLDRSQARLMKLQARLGFDPLSRARLGRDVAAAQVDYAALYAQREAAERAEQ